MVYIVSTESDHRIRIISARDATRHERRRYEETE
ncbi:MAG: BrnT family toxin [Deltaproteobacteria bacterium]|nr:MAG: BrnT family toxin [Deltaproteobacteria bacterium]TMQ13484.1 MAG: BrnT family toxin [Deltaproteobacteria bacterium]